MKWIRKRDQHPPWCGRCQIHSSIGGGVLSDFRGNTSSFSDTIGYSQEKCQFSTKSIGLPCQNVTISCLVTTYKSPGATTQAHTTPNQFRWRGFKNDHPKIPTGRISTDYSLAKADQEDVVRSVKFQGVASQVGTSSIHQAKMVGLNIKSVVKIQG